MTAGTWRQNEVKKMANWSQQAWSKQKCSLHLNMLYFPASGNLTEPPVSCFLETPDSTRYTHGTFSLSGLFHLTYPTPALEAFPSWFSNSWNLLTVTGQVSLAHMATQPGMFRSCLNRIRGLRSPQAPSPDPSKGPSSAARSGWHHKAEVKVTSDSEWAWDGQPYSLIASPLHFWRVLSRVFASHHCISSNKTAVSLCFSAKVHFLIRG